MRTHKAVAIAVATLGMMLGGAATARAGKITELSGQTVVVPAGGYLYCVASANSRRPVTLAVTAIDATGATVADPPISSTTFRAGSGPYFVEERVAFAGDPASAVTASCRVVIEGNVTNSSLKVCGCTFGQPCPPCTQ